MSKHKWTDEQLSYLTEIAQDYYNYEIVEILNKKFNLELTIGKVIFAKKKYDIKGRIRGVKVGTPSKIKGRPKIMNENQKRCQFKKGHKIFSIKPVGTEVKNTNGYTIIKVANPDKWIPKSHYIWQKYNGRKVKKGEQIVFLDGDKTNFDPENLILTKIGEIQALTMHHKYTNNADINKALLVMNRLKRTIKELEK